ncbi:hypothetical protein TIFTF001_007359 [Ficus carica]|uniref:Glutaredoxin domain-containing protein n=1 Tax=Ficus carica TaxID=3494 RepID=A0AA88A6D3_FICCA|nr:hypothetical protein TIFTF001_007359 [Ficus carica]
MFSRSCCAMCHSIKTLMRHFGANLTVYELDQLQNGRQIEAALAQLGCRPAVPAVYIGQQFVGGADVIMKLRRWRWWWKPYQVRRVAVLGQTAQGRDLGQKAQGGTTVEEGGSCGWTRWCYS